MNIIKSTVLRYPKIMWTIIKNTPTLDLLVIFKNAKIYIGYDQGNMIGFLSIKQFGSITELGTLYVFPEFRRHGYAEQLSDQAKKDYSELYLLCTPDMSEMYVKYGFIVVDYPTGVMKLRKKLFDMFIAPIVGYRIMVMKNK
mgnify:CR=1 FL=1